MVMKGRPHAGLPLLNGGAIAGYLLGAIAAGIALLDAVGLTPYL
jgi:presenilin-like A22 family membrane protease